MLLRSDEVFRLFRDAVAARLHEQDGYRCTSIAGIALTDDIREEARLLARNHQVNYVDAVAFCMFRSNLLREHEITSLRSTQPVAGMAHQPVRFSTDNPLRLVLSIAMVVRGNVYTSPGIRAVAPYFPVIQDFLDCVQRLAQIVMNDPALSMRNVEFSLNFADRPDSGPNTYTLNITTHVQDAMLRTTFTFCYHDDCWHFREVAIPNRTFDYPARFSVLQATPPSSRPVAPPLPESPARSRRSIRLGG